MRIIKWYKSSLANMIKQATFLSKKYGMNRGRVIISEIWCRFCYGADLTDYVRFEFHKKKHNERNRYLTIHRWEKMSRRFAETRTDIAFSEL